MKFSRGSRLRTCKSSLFLSQPLYIFFFLSQPLRVLSPQAAVEARVTSALGEERASHEPAANHKVRNRFILFLRRHAARGGRDETCPVSTGGGTRRVPLVLGEGRDVSR